MKILISDYPDVLRIDAEMERKRINKKHPDWEVEIYPYFEELREEFALKLRSSDALITAFVPIDAEMLSNPGKLKCISVNASGYNTIDVSAAGKANVMVCTIGNYCAEEVAEHTMAMIYALSRKLKYYDGAVEHKGHWDYRCDEKPRRISGQKIGIFGFGTIGKSVARMAESAGMTVYVYCDSVHGIGDCCDRDIIPASKETILKECTVITNHMSQNKDNISFFDFASFMRMKNKPIFINTGREEAVDEDALIFALDHGIVYAAGLDVIRRNRIILESDLINRDNVIITPHAAFYSEESMNLLIKRTCDNLFYYFSNKKKEISRIVS